MLFKKNNKWVSSEGKVSNQIQMASPWPLLNFYVYGCFTWVYVWTHYGLGWPGTHYVPQAGLEPTADFLPLPAEHWD